MGSLCSKSKNPSPPINAPDRVDDTTGTTSSSNAPIQDGVSASRAAHKLKVYIIYYSMYGHVQALAKSIKEGVDSEEGVEGHLYRVQETLDPHVLDKMKAPQKDKNVPIISAK
eukprot:c41120_g1_i1 orf=91-429(+)